jgi:hypothetical protein
MNLNNPSNLVILISSKIFGATEFVCEPRPYAGKVYGEAESALRSAKILLDAGDIEGACNRAYYAMYDAAHAALRR